MTDEPEDNWLMEAIKRASERCSVVCYGSQDRKHRHRWAVHIRYRETLYSDTVYALDPMYSTFKFIALRRRQLILSTSGWAMQDSVVIGAGEEPYFTWLGDAE